MTLSYGLSLSAFLVASVQVTSMVENIIVSVERVEQYMHIPSEAAEVIQGHQPPHNWPLVGRVEICDLQVNNYVSFKTSSFSSLDISKHMK